MTYKELTLKIPRQQTIDLAKPLPETDSLLIDNSESPLEFVKSQHIDAGLPDDAWSNLEKEVGTKYRFYYRLERFDAQKPLCGEAGIGKLIDTPKGLALERTFPLTFANEDGATSSINVPQTIVCDNWNPSSKILISCMFPERYQDVTIDPHVIVYSDINSPYNPLYVNENSLVGRIKSSIRNISFTELFKKITQLSLTQLILTTPKKPKEVEGSIVYDSKTKSLKFFDGEVWKRLVDEDT